MSRPDLGTRVEVHTGAFNDGPAVKATVHTLLDTQFVAVTATGRDVFAFYRNEGTDWSRTK